MNAETGPQQWGTIRALGISNRLLEDLLPSNNYINIVHVYEEFKLFISASEYLCVESE
jgi:hypothetical protein